jgi:hypothetical protein
MKSFDDREMDGPIVSPFPLKESLNKEDEDKKRYREYAE